jgi:hypothetical protein
MKAHPAAEAICPLAAVDQRLADAHRLWHQAEAAYLTPMARSAERDSEPALCDLHSAKSQSGHPKFSPMVW